MNEPKWQLRYILSYVVLCTVIYTLYVVSGDH